VNLSPDLSHSSAVKSAIAAEMVDAMLAIVRSPSSPFLALSLERYRAPYPEPYP
jgi:hypothetical protein